ncbi:MAG: hypothetical protein R3A46_14865 [Thermomicrobiales bacterium]
MANTAAQAAGLEFKGNQTEQQRAELIFGLFQARGAFFAADAPITLTVSSLAEALSSMGEDASEADVESMLNANDHIFMRDDSRDDLAFVTTKMGTPPSAGDGAADSHELAERFATPEPPRERVRPKATDSDLSSDDIVAETSSTMEFPPDSWQAAVAAALREAGQPSDEVVVTEAEDIAVETPEAPEESPAEVVEEDVLIAEDVTEEAEAAVEEEAEPEVVEAAEPVEPEAEAEQLEAEEEVVEESVSEPAPPEPLATTIEDVDVPNASDAEIADAIELAMRDEPAAVRWGDLWMHEDNIPDLSQDDMNKIQEMLGGASEAVSDYALVRELRPDPTPGSEEFEIERFAVNYRMSRDLGQFEFVGTARQSSGRRAGQTSLGTDKRKISEIGQDYRFLLDYRTPDAELEPGLVEHVLTFYEHRLGVLPLNANFATIMPKAAFNDQRATRLTFESPQTFETFEVDLRYPTSSRGGFLVGFEEFFAENLVPGAVVTIEATRDRETHFIIEYFQISRQDRKLLQFNERRNTFIFQSTTYFCATQDGMLIDDNHFERLADVEPMDEESLRHVDKIVGTTFERVGTRTEEDGDVHYRANIVDVLAAANIERPISEPYLRDILLGGAYPEFQADESEEDVFIYVAPAS